MQKITHQTALAAALGLLATTALAADNGAPEMKDVELFGSEDEPIAATLKARDPDGDPLQFRLAKPPKNGEATVDAGGKLSYRPKANWFGNDELMVEVTDGKAKVPRKVTLAVSAVNDAPAAAALELKAQEDKQARGQVAAKDADGDPLTYAVGDAPAQGALEVDRVGKLTYTPPANHHGTVTMSVRVSDGTTDAKVPVTVVLAPENDAPEAKDDQATTDEDKPIQGQLPVSDVDQDALSVTVTKKPAHGSLEVDAAKGSYAYQPAKDFAGDDGFSFTVSDGHASAKGNVAILVRNLNDPPSVQPLALSGDEDTEIKGKVIAKDPDADHIFFTLKSEPKTGDAELDEAGNVTFTPAKDFVGTESFNVEVSDFAGGTIVAVTATVRPVNDAPVAAEDSFRGNEDQPITGAVKATDVDKDALRFALAKWPKNGMIELSPDGKWKLMPNANWHGEDSFVAEVSDGKATAQATVAITIKPVNDAPQAVDAAVTTSEDTAVKGSIKGTDIDKDALEYAIGKAPKLGQATIDARSGAFVYQPSANSNGDDTFSVKVSDGPATVEVTVSARIAPVNDAPVATASEKKGDEDVALPGALRATDVDQDTLSYAITAMPKNGAVELNPSTGAYAYTPRTDFHGNDAFRWEVSDGKLKASAEVKMTIAAVNDAPVVKAVALAATEDKAASVVVGASDVDKDKLSWSEAKAPAKGKIAVDAASGKVVYTPRDNENGEDSFTVAVSDGAARTEAVVAVAIAPINDAPVALPRQAAGPEDTPIKGALGAKDLDGDALTWSVVSKPRRGSVEVEATSGVFTYTPAANENGADAFRFEVSDGKLKAAADVAIALEAVNDTPVPKDVAASGSEDRELGGKVTATDIDKDALTFRLKKGPAHGAVLVDDASGAFRLAPSRDFNGKDSFVVEVSDGFATADATVSVELAAAPDAPLIDPKPIETAEDSPVTVPLAALEPDGDKVTFQVVSASKLGAASIGPDGASLTFTPHANVHGEDTLGIEASDGKLKVRASLPVRVAPKNDAPTVDAAKAELLEESTAGVALLARDQDGDVVKLALEGAPSWVSLKGSLLMLAPPRDFAGALEVAVVPSDAGGKGVATKVPLVVVNVNDAPVAKDHAVQVAPGGTVAVALEASDVDAGDELSFAIAVPARQGTVVIDDAKAGRLRYTANADARGQDTFRVRVKDKAGASATATVRVTLGAAPKPAAGARSGS